MHLMGHDGPRVERGTAADGLPATVPAPTMAAVHAWHVQDRIAVVASAENELTPGGGLEEAAGIEVVDDREQAGQRIVARRVLMVSALAQDQATAGGQRGGRDEAHLGVGDLR